MEKLARKLSSLFGYEVEVSKKDRHLRLDTRKEELPDICKKLSDLGMRFITMVGSDEREVQQHFGLYYVFASDEESSFVTVRAAVAERNPSFPSVTPSVPACDWYEREVHDLLGLTPVGHPNLMSLILHDDWPRGVYPLRKEYPHKLMQASETSQNWFPTVYEGEGVTKVPVGPIHAGIIEPGHFLFGVAGDAILHLDAQLFFKHRGLEKKSEGMPVEKGLFLAERICGTCALSHAVSYALAVEKIAEVKIPKRAKYLRMIFLELERLTNHIGDVGDICSGAGFHFGTNHGARLKEELQQLSEQLIGHRFLRGYIALGGVRQDVATKKLMLMLSTLARIRRDFRELVNILLEHEITLDRMATTGYLTEKNAHRHEVVGPAGRASGRKIDIRKSHPYLLYEEMDFEVPHCTEGDVLARVHVRIDEAFESFALIQQLVEKIEEGSVRTELKKLPAYKIGLGWTESALGENVHWLMTGKEGEIYRYRVRSAAYSNWPAVPSTVKGNIVPDFPIINKSFELCYACCDR